MIADMNGDERLVPPIPNHPGGVCVSENVAQKLSVRRRVTNPSPQADDDGIVCLPALSGESKLD